MGLHSSIFSEISCPACGSEGVFEVQFTFGSTRLQNYHVGDMLIWGANDIGPKGMQKVRVDGISGCPNCEADFIEFDVMIENDRIVGLTPLGLERGNETYNGYTIIEK